MDTCIFCKIIKGEIPGTKIYEDKNVYVFLDILPESYGHTLLVPKKHSRNIFDIDKKTLLSLIQPIKNLSLAIKKATNADGITIIMNNGRKAGQLVFHSHIHIIPRHTKKKERGSYKKGEIEKIAKKIREKLKNI